MSSSLNQILNTGKTGILAHQAAIATTTKNTANVNTPEYAKRDLLFSSAGTIGGVTVESRRRQTDLYLGGKILDAAARRGSADSASIPLAAIDQMFADRPGGLGDSMDEFFNTLRGLAANPVDLDRRREFLSQAKALTESVSTAAQRLSEEQRRADQLVDGMISQANAIIEDIARLNGKAGEIIAAGNDAGDVLDQRDQLVKSLGGIIEINTFQDPDGTLTVLFNGEVPLVQGPKHSRLQATADPAYNNLRRVDIINISGRPTDITGRLDQGELGGVIDLRDKGMTTLIDRLDQLAFDLSTQFNTVHQLGYGLDGVAGRNFFQPVATPGGAAAAFSLATGIEMNPDWIAASLDVLNPVGDNQNLLDLTDLEDQTLASSSTRTFGEELADLIGSVGRLVKGNQDDFERSTVELNSLNALNSSRIGVSLDEEMIDLMRFQQAFQAGAKIIETVSQMFAIINQLK